MCYIYVLFVVELRVMYPGGLVVLWIMGGLAASECVGEWLIPDYRILASVVGEVVLYWYFIA